jgi:hypothetical protein
MPEIIAKILRNNRKPLADLGLGIPAEFDAVVGRCLASDREGRFADVAELAEALLPFCNAHGAPTVDRILRVRGRRSMPPQPSRLYAAATPLASERPSTGTEPAVRSENPGVAATQLAVSTGLGTPSGPPARRSTAWLAAPAVALLALGGIGAWMWKVQSVAPTGISPVAVLADAGVQASTASLAASTAPAPSVAAVASIAPSIAPPPAPSVVASGKLADLHKKPGGDAHKIPPGGKPPQPPPPGNEPGKLDINIK